MCLCQLRSLKNDSLFFKDVLFMKMGGVLLDFLCNSEHDWVLEALNWTRFLVPQSINLCRSSERDMCIDLRLSSSSSVGNGWEDWILE